MLTAEECKVAAERARKYPPGFGGVFVPVVPTKEQVEKVTGRLWNEDHYTGNLLGEMGLAAQWLAAYPEDIEKGCPAVAVAAKRGRLHYPALDYAFFEVAEACGLNGPDYCKLLTKDPETVAKALEKQAQKLEERDRVEAHKRGMQSSS